MSTESNNSTQRQLGDFAEDHEHEELAAVSIGQECSRLDCERIMSKRFARSNDTCAFCQPMEDDE